MRIIDRYVLRNFVQSFVICFLSLTGLYVVFDAFANLDEFIRYSEKHGQLLVVMGEYYAYRTLFFFDRIGGIMALIASMFTVAWLRRNNEMTALLAGGISGARIVRPIIAAAIALSLMAAGSREIVIPACRTALSRDPKDLAGEAAQKLALQYDNESDILFRGEQTFRKDQRIFRPDFGLPASLELAWGKSLTGENAFYRPAAPDQPAGYLIDKVSEPKDLVAGSSIAINGKPVILTPKDAKFLQPDQCFVVSNVSFEQLTGGKAWRQFSSTPDLIRGLRNPSLDYRADVRVTVHGRFVQPLLDVTLLFLGLPLVLGRESRNVFATVATCLALVAVFVLTLIASQHLGATYYVSPALAAWLPLLIFAPIAWALSDSVRN